MGYVARGAVGWRVGRGRVWERIPKLGCPHGHDRLFCHFCCHHRRTGAGEHDPSGTFIGSAWIVCLVRLVNPVGRAYGTE